MKYLKFINKDKLLNNVLFYLDVDSFIMTWNSSFKHSILTPALHWPSACPTFFSHPRLHPITKKRPIMEILGYICKFLCPRLLR
jgi:hypothetical protein